VKPSEPWQREWRHAQKKPPQSLRIGIRWQTSKILKDPIVLEDVTGFDPAKPECDGIDQGQNRLGNCVAVVPLNKAGLVGEQRSEPEFPEEEEQQIYAAEVGKALPGEGQDQIFWAESHYEPTSLLGRFLREQL